MQQKHFSSFYASILTVVWRQKYYTKLLYQNIDNIFLGNGKIIAVLFSV